MSKGYYAVVRGRVPGVYLTWRECEAQVRSFPRALYKKFPTSEAALDWIVKEGGPTPESLYMWNGESDSLPPPLEAKETLDLGLPSKPPVLTTGTDESGPRTVIYADGSCLFQGCADAKAGAGIYFGEGDPRNTADTVPGAQTNNRAEIWALIRALDLCPEGALELRSDSRLALYCANGLMKPKKNLDLFQLLWLKMQGRDIVFTWVKGHAHDPGNEAADALARLGTQVTSH